MHAKIMSLLILLLFLLLLLLLLLLLYDWGFTCTLALFYAIVHLWSHDCSFSADRTDGCQYISGLAGRLPMSTQNHIRI